MRSRSKKNKIKKTAGNNGEQACQTSWLDAFSNIMELAHNICLSQVGKNGSFNGKTKGLMDCSLNEKSMLFRSQILFYWSRVSNGVARMLAGPLPAIRS